MAEAILRADLKGLTLNGRAIPLVESMVIGCVEELADYTYFEVRAQLDKVLVNPTGYYESQIRNDAIDPYTHSVNDSNVIYGPWLEGIGSRNFPVTKFEGYHTFRIVKNRMEQKTKAILVAHAARVMGEL